MHGTKRYNQRSVDTYAWRRLGSSFAVHSATEGNDKEDDAVDGRSLNVAGVSTTTEDHEEGNDDRDAAVLALGTWTDFARLRTGHCSS